MINNIQIFISDSFDAYKNLATEKYLFDTVDESSCILYLWQNKNTVVIGRNQNAWAECKTSLLEEEKVTLARRLSGGGAVFHDLGNLNFTFLTQTKNYDLEKNLEVLKKACSYANIETEFSGRNDILASGKKFSGNAFYNSKGRSYHHGTILVCADKEKMSRYLTPPEAKLEAKGIKSVKSRVVNLSELSPTLTISDMKRYMVLAFEKVYNKKAELIEKTNKKKILQLSEEYSKWDYLYGKSLPASISVRKQFSWGNAELKIMVSNGVIADLMLYTDSLDVHLPEKLKTALTSCRFEQKAIDAVLYSVFPENTAKDLSQLFTYIF